MRIPPLWLVVAIPAATSLAAWLQPAPKLSGVALGRRVYVAEGCIHCHSQYVRPGTSDEAWWGEPRDPEFSRRQVPSLIGNRRQGPDLMNAGRRLSREWQRLHLVDPRRLVPTSRMPSYAYLFADDEPRGEALLDYLGSLGSESDSSIAPSTAAGDSLTDSAR